MRKWDFFEPSRPRPVKGGIKAQSRRGAFGTSWWGKRWLAVLASFDLGARLSRGKSYARKGQVVSVAVDRGMVTADVQGSRKDPYRIKIALKVFKPSDWKNVAKLLAAEPLIVAKMLAGELPGEVEQVFAGARLPLFPERHDDLKTSCSCPDWSNPCKHIAAVYYILGENFDQDPFLIFKLRGQDRQDLFKMMGITPANSTEQTAANNLSTPVTARIELPTDPTSFWKGKPEPDKASGALPIPEISLASPKERQAMAAALPRRLGNFPFWQGEKPLLDMLEPLYQRVVEAGLTLMMGGEKEQSSSD